MKFTVNLTITFEVDNKKLCELMQKQNSTLDEIKTFLITGLTKILAEEFYDDYYVENANITVTVDALEGGTDDE